MTKNVLLLFDFDGVLVDSLDLYAEAVTLCLTRIGKPILRSREDYLDLFDGNFYESMAARGVDLDAFTRVAAEILPGIDYGRMKPYAGLIPVLTSLAERNFLAVVSSNGRKAIGAILERFGFAPYFQEILGSDFLLSKKEKIDFALDKYGFSREKTVYVGDTAGDIVEARAAGIRSAAVTWGWHSRERLLAMQPDFLIDTPAGLLTIDMGNAL